MKCVSHARRCAFFGGKFKLGPWIIQHFPPHHSYVEPCCGGCSVLLQKPVSPLETINDLDGSVVNFFRVLRDSPEKLIEKINLTPWARKEFENAVLTIDDGDDLERARKFFIRSWMSMHGGQSHLTDWRRRHSGRNPVLEIRTLDLMTIAERLSTVQIENDTAERIISAYDGPDTLIYFDPPYVMDTRTRFEGYKHEWTDEDHAHYAELLHKCSGYVVVSGYDCELYSDLYGDWTRYDKEVLANSGAKKVESIWLSPNISVTRQVTLW